MTNEEWDNVEQQLFLLQRVDLVCDGYNINLCIIRIKMKLVIGVFLNGKIDFNCAETDCEIRRKFFNSEKHYRYPAKIRVQLKKFSKKRLKEQDVNPNETWLFYSPLWKSFSSLKRHLIKNCKSIEVI